MGIDVQRFQWDYIDSNMYVLKQGNEALVIDSVDSEEAFDYLREFEDIYVLLTHEHFDHISGLNRLRQEHNCYVIAQRNCSKRIQNTKENLSAFSEIIMKLADKPCNTTVIPFICEEADITFNENYSFTWYGYSIEIVATPGHSPGSCCILIEQMLFTGDTILENGPMNRFPGGSQRIFAEKSVPVLRNVLDACSEIYPGHGEVHNIEYYKKWMQLLKPKTECV